MSDAKSFRRVVTGHNAAGKSTFVIDADSPHIYQRTPGSAVITEIWETCSSPADNRGNDDAIDHPFRRYGHVGNALALSKRSGMSTAMLRALVVEFSTRRCLANN
jgi:hypothetical protein